MVNIDIKMLSKYLNRSWKVLCRRTAASFSGGHDHHHHDYSVHIDLDAPLIKYKSDPKLAWFEGYEDRAYPLPTLENSDPFAHLNNAPLFSFERFIYNDPWYHDDSHQIYNSAPERGYINGQDPLQTRFRYQGVVYVALSALTLMIMLSGVLDADISPTQGLVHMEKVSRNYVEDQLRKKNQELNKLKLREVQLLQALAK